MSATEADRPQRRLSSLPFIHVGRVWVNEMVATVKNSVLDPRAGRVLHTVEARPALGCRRPVSLGEHQLG
jgi:hypothetical protein